MNSDPLKTYVTFSIKKSLTCRRSKIVAGNQGIKATASGSAVVATEPLTKEDLVSYFASGCKPQEMWRIGPEHEKFVFEMKTFRPMRYEQITSLLNGIAERFEWDKVMENGRIIGNASISFEPGGQLELSGAPLETLHQTSNELHSHLHQVKTVAEELGIGFLGIGFEPKSNLKDITSVPKRRYDFVRDHLVKVGSSGPDMMLRTCTVEVNLDYSSETDMIRKFRATLALQPIANALSPITGLKAMFRDGPLKHVAEDVLKLAKDGLERRGYEETGFLNVIAEVVRTGVTPAEKLLELYNGDWGQSVDPVFKELQY